MKVKDLKEIINGLPEEMEIVLQRDSEGNGYSPLAGGDDKAVYVAENTWSGIVYDMGWDADDAAVTEDEWKEIQSLPRCLVLYPIN